MRWVAAAIIAAVSDALRFGFSFGGGAIVAVAADDSKAGSAGRVTRSSDGSDGDFAWSAAGACGGAPGRQPGSDPNR